MEIKNLENTDFDTIFRGFQRAFADYEIHFEKEEVREMLRRRGYTPRLSFAAFDKDEIVAFTLNGTGYFNGLPSAYDTGTGTAKEHRGQGLAGKIFNHSIPYLKEAGIDQYVLEVLQNNTNAIAVYRKMDFETSREFDCFRQTIENIQNPTPAEIDYSISSIGIDEVRAAQTFCDFTPSWQNSIESIERGEAALTFLGAGIEGKLAGFCVFDPATGDLTQIAVKPEYRRRGIASQLLKSAIEAMKTDFIKVLNVSSDNQTLPRFLASKNIPLATKQFEMINSFVPD